MECVRRNAAAGSVSVGRAGRPVRAAHKSVREHRVRQPAEPASHQRSHSKSKRFGGGRGFGGWCRPADDAANLRGLRLADRRNYPAGHTTRLQSGKKLLNGPFGRPGRCNRVRGIDHQRDRNSSRTNLRERVRPDPQAGRRARSFKECASLHNGDYDSVAAVLACQSRRGAIGCVINGEKAGS